MKEIDANIVNVVFEELNSNLKYCDLINFLKGELIEPVYPEVCVGNKYFEPNEVGLTEGFVFDTIADYKKLGDKLESLEEEYPNLRNIELSDERWEISFIYDRAPDEWEVKSYQEGLESYNIIQKHSKFIKERYEELSQQKKDEHNEKVLAEIEKLKKKLL